MGCSGKSFNNILFNNFLRAIIASLRHAQFIVGTLRALQGIAAQSSASSGWLPTDVKTKHSHPCIPAPPDKWGASDVTFLKHLQLQSMSFLRQPSLSLMFADQRSLISHVSQMSESHWLEICIEVAGPVTIEKSEHVLCLLMPIAVPCQSYAWN